jgi:hypothetical protein
MAHNDAKCDHNTSKKALPLTMHSKETQTLENKTKTKTKRTPSIKQLATRH